MEAGAAEVEAAEAVEWTALAVTVYVLLAI